MRLVRLLWVALLLSAPMPITAAHAQPISLHVRTAGDLADMCSADPKTPTGPARLNYCSGFAQGAVDVRLHDAGDKKPFCITSGVRREVTLHEFASWVRSDPSRRSDDALSSLFRFLGERFPCQ
jgi:hypothetical protein